LSTTNSSSELPIPKSKPITASPSGDPSNPPPLDSIPGPEEQLQERIEAEVNESFAHMKSANAHLVASTAAFNRRE